ncbi:aminotransferase class I/II-fold pyridoxal phosphate-dependent enzyme [Sphaerisporangium rhizosphaerae]|uniref:Aminotransferase class I/II-fold pyridoxal phosphate-dependent enzyme n=1 Tax=Sphaerisporangium rhizosphaerae TaxID=2269375 RepID=A0ABW2PFA0_9ACTN
MPADEEERLAQPLERFARLHAETVRRSGRRLLDLSYPNPRVDRDTRAYDLLRGLVPLVPQQDLQYTPLGGGTIVRRRVASSLARRLGVPLGHRDVLLTPGATAALIVALTALFRPGDEVLIVTPCWMDYPLYLHRLGAKITLVPSGSDKRIPVERVAASIGPRTAGLILGQPACPTGVVHTAAELAMLADVLRAAAARFGRHAVLVSDEAHRDQVWGDAEFTSPMRLYPHTVSVYSFGKAWSLQGQRTGYLALSPSMCHHDDVAVRAERAMRSTGTCAPTALMQRLIPQIVDLEPDQGSLRRDQTRIRAELERLGYRIVAGQATAFVYIHCPDGIGDWEFATRLAGQNLLAMPSEVFHDAGHVRLALNVDAERFPEIGRRLLAAAPPPSP